MQVARHLARVVAVEQQAQRVRVALQILAMDELFQLLLLAAEAALQFARLAGEVLERAQAAALRAELVQVALGLRDFLFDVLELIGDVGALAFGGDDALFERFNLSAQFLEVALLVRHLAVRWCCFLGLGQRRRQCEHAGQHE